MKQITLKGPDDVLGLIEQLAHHMNGVEIVNVFDDAMTETETDECFRMAITELKEEHVLRKPRDYAWIMTSIEQHVISELKAFESPQSFIDYLRHLGISGLPHRSTLSRAYNTITGKFPEWTYSKKPSYYEERRRIAVVVRFQSAFLKYKRAICNNKCTKLG